MTIVINKDGSATIKNSNKDNAPTIEIDKNLFRVFLSSLDSKRWPSCPYTLESLTKDLSISTYCLELKFDADDSQVEFSKVRLGVNDSLYFSYTEWDSFIKELKTIGDQLQKEKQSA